MMTNDTYAQDADYVIVISEGLRTAQVGGRTTGVPLTTPFPLRRERQPLLLHVEVRE